jgi:hypothetical protein
MGYFFPGQTHIYTQALVTPTPAAEMDTCNVLEKQDPGPGGLSLWLAGGELTLVFP